MAERAEILVTVKASPAISQKYGEVVCVAGIRTDVDPPVWARLWPIHYRDMPFAQRFKKYQFIELEVSRRPGDNRPESWRPNVNSLKLGKVVTSRNGWSARRKLVEPLVTDSMCQLEREQQSSRTSLGLFRPADVQDFLIDSDSADWEPEKQAIINQPSLLYPTKSGLEKVPYKFRYVYRCADRVCPGHKHMVIDWELAGLYRHCRDRYDEQGLRAALRDKWLNEMCGAARDTLFYVGNMHQHPKNFLVLGVYWPPKI